MSYINGHKVISVVRTVYQSELDLIARYHLGEYDTYVDNEDGTATITRQTGYADLGSLNWTYNSTYGIWVAPLDVVNNSTAISSKYTFKLTAPNNLGTNEFTTNWSWYGSTPSIFVNNGSSTTQPSGLLQNQLATSYTEQVIVNRPLNTLDQNGSQWLRSEWEKGLNLWDEETQLGYWSNSNGSFVSTNSDLCSKNRTVVLPNTTYSITATWISNDKGYRIAFYDNNDNYINSYSKALSTQTYMTFTTPSNAKYIRFSIYGGYGTTYNHDIMIVEGDHAYPYQEYNGELIHRKDIEPVLLWENASPSATYSSGDITLDTAITNYKYLVIAYREKQYGAIHYTKIKTASSIPNGYLIGAAQISGNEQGVCRSFTISTSGTKISFYNDKVYGGSSGYGYYCIPIAIYGTDVL